MTPSIRDRKHRSFFDAIDREFFGLMPDHPAVIDWATNALCTCVGSEVPKKWLAGEEIPEELPSGMKDAARGVRSGAFMSNDDFFTILALVRGSVPVEMRHALEHVVTQRVEFKADKVSALLLNEAGQYKLPAPIDRMKFIGTVVDAAKELCETASRKS